MLNAAEKEMHDEFRNQLVSLGYQGEALDSELKQTMSRAKKNGRLFCMAKVKRGNRDFTFLQDSLVKKKIARLESNVDPDSQSAPIVVKDTDPIEKRMKTMMDYFESHPDQQHVLDDITPPPLSGVDRWYWCLEEYMEIKRTHSPMEAFLHSPIPPHEPKIKNAFITFCMAQSPEKASSGGKDQTPSFVDLEREWEKERKLTKQFVTAFPSIALCLIQRDGVGNESSSLYYYDANSKSVTKHEKPLQLMEEKKTIARVQFTLGHIECYGPIPPDATPNYDSKLGDGDSLEMQIKSASKEGRRYQNYLLSLRDAFRASIEKDANSKSMEDHSEAEEREIIESTLYELQRCGTLHEGTMQLLAHRKKTHARVEQSLIQIYTHRFNVDMQSLGLTPSAADKKATAIVQWMLRIGSIAKLRRLAIKEKLPSISLHRDEEGNIVKVVDETNPKITDFFANGTTTLDIPKHLLEDTALHKKMLPQTEQSPSESTFAMAKTSLLTLLKSVKSDLTRIIIDSTIEARKGILCLDGKPCTTSFLLKSQQVQKEMNQNLETTIDGQFEHIKLFKNQTGHWSVQYSGSRPWSISPKR